MHMCACIAYLCLQEKQIETVTREAAERLAACVGYIQLGCMCNRTISSFSSSEPRWPVDVALAAGVWMGLWLLLVGSTENKSTYPMSMECPLALEYSNIRDQMPIPWRKSAPIQPYRTDPWRHDTSSSVASLQTSSCQRPRELRRGASSSQWLGTYLARNKRPSPPAGRQLLELKRSRLHAQVCCRESMPTVVSVATQYSTDSSLQLTRFC